MTNTYYVAGIPFSSYNSLAHHGIKGQKWGVRRFQNPDGTLTEAGKARYRQDYDNALNRDSAQYISDTYKAIRSYAGNRKTRDLIKNALDSGNSYSKDIMSNVKEFGKLSKDLNEAFTKYSDKMAKETGREWDGDGTEEHWALEKRYSDYAKLSKQYDAQKERLIESVKKATNSGLFNGAFQDTSNLLYRYDDKKHNWSEILDGRNACVGEILSDIYKVELFVDDFREARELNKGRLGKIIKY